MTKRNERLKAIEMRMGGATIIEIANGLGVAKSSAYMWTKDIDLSDEVKQRIYDICKASQFKKGNTLGREYWTDEMRNAASIKAKIVYDAGGYIKENLAATNSVHRKIEADAKYKIEQFFCTSGLLPQKINGRWFDFVNDEFVIEYTIDNTKGISDAISRFGIIIGDNRRKILVSPERWFGLKRRELLSANGAIFVSIDDVFNILVR